MMKNTRFATILVLILMNICTYGQDAPVVHFQSGDKIFSENIEAFFSNPDVSSEDVIDNLYYRYIQFNEIPDQEDQDAIIATGINLLEYLPDNTYLVAIPTDYPIDQLSSFDIRSIVKTDVEDKLDQRLIEQTWPAWADAGGGNIKVILKAYIGTSETTFLNLLRDANISFSKEDIHFPFVYAKIAPIEFFAIAGQPFIQYVDIGPDPGEPEDSGGRNLQRANLINNLLAGGLRYDASGVNILVRDDGVVGPHIDFEGRMFDFTGGSNAGTHGDGVAGVFAGAGNLEPLVAGSASGAGVFVTNYQSEFTDNTIDLHQNNDVVITNSSYSNGCNAGYTVITQRVDQQMIDHPNLMHVFSGGNSNNNDCGYGAGNQWGNVTGGHKVGKNVMAVANLFADGTLVSSSSRGPAHDGRIKPDISAHGQNERSTNTDNTYQTFGGTSAAAPTMAGSYAQLYQAYRALNGGSDPNTGFLKAVVLNSAHDKGNIGPDFKYGWGRIDAYQGLKILEDNTYTSSTISQGEMKTHDITIPAGVAEARMMVYWVDPSGAVNSSKALVNDLDIYVNDPGATRHDPWVLDHTPNATTLDLPATRGPDHLNNMEQVLITSPTAGVHTVNVSGTAVPMGSQKYYVIWTFFYNEIMVTYPLGGEGLVPGETERIHWDAFGNTGTFNLDYSTNNGASWNNISSGINAATRLFTWTIPNSVTSEALVRVSRGGQSDVSDANFSIIRLPGNIHFTNNCRTGATLNWNAVPGADQYVVYRLGAKYMEPVGTTAALSMDFNDLITDETEWFSVQATNNQGAEGRRANAVSYFADPGFINCRNTIKLEKTVSATEAKAGDTLDYTLSFTSFYNNAITGVTVTDALDPLWEYIDNSLSCGTENNGTITLNHGTVNPDQTITCTFKVRSSVLLFSEEVFEDDIENGTANWTIDNITGPQVWQVSTFKANSPINSWLAPDRGLENNTQALVLNAISLPERAELSFFHDYDTEAGWDGGFVEISIDNGAIWTDLGSKITQNGYNGGLGNGSNSAIANRSAFTGNSGGFIETLIDLSDYSGSVLIRFVFGEDNNTGALGWYIDDVNITSTFSQKNIACVVYDQGAMECSEVKTLMLPCEQNCDPCTDGIQNGDETDIDCGGTLCPLCPCTQANPSLVYMDEVIIDGTDQRLKTSILTMGHVITGSNSTVNLSAGNEILFNEGFATGASSNLTIIMEDCQ